MRLGRDQRSGEATAGGLRGHISVPLFRNAYFLIASSVLSSALGLPFWALAAHSYNAAVIGRSSALLSALSLVAGVSALGMSSVLVRYLPVMGKDTGRVVLTTYGVTLLVSLALGTLAAFLSHAWSPSLAFLALQARWFALFVITTPIWAISGLQDGVLTGLREARWVPIENVLFSCTKLVLVVALSSGYPRSGIVLAWVISLAASIVPVNLFIFWKVIPARTAAGADTHGRTLRWSDVRQLAVGNFVGDFASLVISFFLPILVLDLAGARDAAYFYVPWMISLGMRFIAQNMATSMTVETAHEAESQRENLQRVATAVLRLLVPTVVVILAGAPYILQVFGTRYSEAGTFTLRLLALGTLPHAVSMLGLGMARLRHNGRFVGAVQAADAATMIVVSVLLIPSMGIAGAGVGWLAAQAVAGGLSVPSLRKALRRPAFSGS